MSQLSLFDTNIVPLTSFYQKGGQNDYEELNKVDGLIYIPNFITLAESSSIWQFINEEIWLDDLKRRVQHYGYKYDYKSRFIDYSMKLGCLPQWSLTVAQRLHRSGFMVEEPDQLIVNEYKPGQGIANHVDCEPCFGNTIASLSLGSACVMDLINKESKVKVSILLEPCSLVILSGAARYQWTHGIQGRKTDTFKNLKFDRSDRISLTFRKVKF
ncbi:alpha-ketoglutarate-dependent dioxygenase AlkB [Spirosoma gilvum]